MIEKLIEKFNKAKFPAWLEFLSACLVGILFAILFVLCF